MGVKVVFVPTTWKTLVNGVVAAKYDMTSSASLSPKRALVAGYSLSYFAVEDVPLMLNKNEGKYNSWEDLNNPNVTVSVTLGTVQEKRAEVLFNKVQDHQGLCPGAGLSGGASRTCRHFHDQ